ncbi:hypothetical protein HOD29_07225 [archaeon]|jgi:hypothetical protein|nr:hypothetical protein [archaeon]
MKTEFENLEDSEVYEPFICKGCGKKVDVPKRMFSEGTGQTITIIRTLHRLGMALKLCPKCMFTGYRMPTS